VALETGQFIALWFRIVLLSFDSTIGKIFFETASETGVQRVELVKSEMSKEAFTGFLCALYDCINVHSHLTRGRSFLI